MARFTPAWTRGPSSAGRPGARAASAQRHRVVVAPEEYGADSIRTAVATVCATPSYARAARRVQREIAAMPDADEVLALLDEHGVGRGANPSAARR